MARRLRVYGIRANRPHREHCRLRLRWASTVRRWQPASTGGGGGVSQFMGDCVYHRGEERRLFALRSCHLVEGVSWSEEDSVSRRAYAAIKVHFLGANNVNVLSSACSPDTSPIEYIWDVMDHHAGQHPHTPANQQEPIQALFSIYYVGLLTISVHFTSPLYLLLYFN